MKEEIKKVFISVAHRIAKLGLVKCSSGNLSMRVEKDLMLITATGSWMEELQEKDISLCNIDDGSVLNDVPPSVELKLHSGIYKARSDINVVLHFQSPYATAVACIEPSFENFNIIPEVPYYIGPIARIPFYPPGSERLALAVKEKAYSSNLIIMQNHGLVTMADNVELLIKRAIFFELACQILFIGGSRIRGLSEDQIKDIGI